MKKLLTLALVSFEEPTISRALVTCEPSKNIDLTTEDAFSNKLAIVPYDPDFAAEQLKKNQESWGSWALKKAVGTTKYASEKLVESGYETAKYLLAWNLNYYGVRTLEEVTAYGVYEGVSLVVVPVAGNSAYYVTKGAFTVGRWVIPGYDGFIAGTYAPLTKAFVIDPLVDNAPAIAKTTISKASDCASYIKSAGNTAYNYFWGQK